VRIAKRLAQVGLFPHLLHMRITSGGMMAAELITLEIVAWYGCGRCRIGKKWEPRSYR
jgi:hypothetical protein